MNNLSSGTNVSRETFQAQATLPPPPRRTARRIQKERREAGSMQQRTQPPQKRSQKAGRTAARAKQMFHVKHFRHEKRGRTSRMQARCANRETLRKGIRAQQPQRAPKKIMGTVDSSNTGVPRSTKGADVRSRAAVFGRTPAIARRQQRQSTTRGRPSAPSVRGGHPWRPRRRDVAHAQGGRGDGALCGRREGRRQIGLSRRSVCRRRPLRGVNNAGRRGNPTPSLLVLLIPQMGPTSPRPPGAWRAPLGGCCTAAPSRGPPGRRPPARTGSGP